ncbi:hypothetical protein BH23GEM10_BH23GEM10_00230 [soil metagenome]
MTFSAERQVLAAWEDGLRLTGAARADALLAATAPPAGSAASAGSGAYAATADVEALPLGEREQRLLLLRRALFGRDIDAVASCPACGERHDVQLDVDTMLAAAPAVPPQPTTVEHGGMTLTVRPLTRGDVAAAAVLPDASAIAARLLECAVTATGHNGEVLDAAALDDAARAVVAAALEEASPFAELTVALTCVQCGGAWSAAFDSGEFLWSEVNDWAQRILRDVHALASAYGWTEADVLALGPWRRSAYRVLAGC